MCKLRSAVEMMSRAFRGWWRGNFFKVLLLT
jgi:hypothetical protein